MTQSNFNENIFYFAVVSVVISIISACLIVMLRSGLDLYLYPISVLICSVFFVGFSPFAVFGFKNLRPIATMTTVVVAMLSLFFIGFLGVFAGPILAGIGLVGAVRGQGAVARIGLGPWLLLVPIACAIAFYVIAVICQGGNTTYLTPERLILGIEHRDVYIRSALARILENQHALSTGLDGMRVVYYHWAFPAFIAALSHIGGSALPALYGFADAVLIAPLMVYALLASAAVFLPAKWGGLRLTLTGGMAILMLGLITWPHMSLQPGYLMALTLSTLALPIIDAIIRKEVGGRVWVREPLLGLFVVLVSLAHPSVGLMLAAASLWAVLRGRSLSIKTMALLSLAPITAIVTAISIYNTFSVSLVTAERLRLNYQMFIFGGVIVPAALLWQLLSQRDSPDASRRAEIVLIAVAASFIPPLVVDFSSGSSAVYFFSAPTWFLLPLMLATSLGSPVPLSLSRAFPTPAAKGLMCFCIIILVGAVHPRLLFNDRIELPDSVVRAVDGVDAEFVRLAIQAGATERRLWPADFVARMNDALGPRIVRLVEAERVRAGRDLAVFVPPENTAFWSMNKECNFQPFFIPGATGVPMLMGLPPESCEVSEGMKASYQLYGSDARARQISDPDICLRARQKGFGTILILENGDRHRILACPAV